MLVLLCILFGCSTNEGPEEIAEKFIDQFEQTIENRDLNSIRSFISENYRDEKGRTRQDIAAIIAGYILRNKAIHIYSRLDSAKLHESVIEATVLSAAAGRSINDLVLLPSLNADMYWVDFALDIEDREPQIIRASWRQAMLDDFLAD